MILEFELQNLEKRSACKTCRRFAVFFSALLFGCALASGCDTAGKEFKTAMSLQEAKALTAELAASEFTPPQRTINDLKDILPADYPVAPNCEPDPLEYDPEPSKPRSRAGGDLNLAAEWSRNSAISAFRYGNFPKALSLVDYARSVLPPGWYLSRGRAGMHLARYYAVLGERARARRVYSASEALFQKGKLDDPHTYNRWKNWHDSERWATRGIIAFIDGQYQEAELLLRKAADTRVSVELLDFNIIRFHLIRAIERQGRLDEAEALARDYLLSRIWAPSGEAGISLVSLARVLLSQGRYEEAEWLAKKAINIYRHKCIPDYFFFPFMANLRLAQALVGQKKWDESLKLFEVLKAATGGRNEQEYENQILSNPDWGIAYIATDRPDKAAEKLKHTAKILADQFGAESYDAIEAENFRDLAIAQAVGGCAGLEPQANNLMRLAALRRVFAEGVGLSRIREQRLALLVNAYLSLALRCIGKAGSERTTADSLFAFAQIGRSGQVQAALAANASRAAAAHPDLAKLVRQLQDAENGARELSRIIAYRLSLPPADVDARTTLELQERLATIRSAAAVLSEAIERDFPGYASLLGVKLVSAREAREHLYPGESVLFIRTAEQESYVWAVPKNGKTRLASVKLGHEKIGELVANLRRSLDPPFGLQSLGDIPDFDVDLAHRLYSAVLKPVAPGWAEASSLLIVVDGYLQQLPFSLLVTEPVDLSDDKNLFSAYRDVPWLARGHAVTMLPSVAAMTTLRNLTPGAETRRAFVGFGDPWFSAKQELTAIGSTAIKAADSTSRVGLTDRGAPIILRDLPAMGGFDSAELSNLPRLPDTADEVIAMASALMADPARDVFLGKAANEQTVKTLDLSQYRVLAFATHGLVPGDINGLSQPALALTAPQVAGIAGDGLLTMGEVLGLNLDADLIVLSACNSAAAEGAGAEAISGLGRAFFYAGARSLLVSNWPVETLSAKELTTGIFKKQAAEPGLDRAEALRQSMIELIDGPGFVNDAGAAIYSYAHPIFWAPFTLVGDGGGAPVAN